MAAFAILRGLNKGSLQLLRPTSSSINVCGLSRTVKIVDSDAKAQTDFQPGYFRARRGPFTPAEKQGKPLMFTSSHWKIERIVAVSMIPIIPTALIVQGPIFDFLLSTTVFMHGFWGFDHVLSDYLQKFLPFIHKLWYIISIIAFAGLMSFNYNDVGVTKAVSMLWKL